MGIIYLFIYATSSSVFRVIGLNSFRNNSRACNLGYFNHARIFQAFTALFKFAVF